LTREESITNLTKPDLFTDNLNLSNLNYFTYGKKTKNHRLDISLIDYFEKVKESCKDPEPEFVELINSTMARVVEKWKEFNFKSVKINIIRTTGEESFNLAYTRGDSIVIPYSVDLKDKNSLHAINESLLFHEIFHILSRNDQSLREECYSYFKFFKVDPINFKGLITNPDCPVYDYAIKLNVGNLIFKEQMSCVPVIYEVDGRFDWNSVYSIEKDLLIHVDSTDLFKIIGTNTKYISHPEEICAEHFRILMTNWFDSKKSKNQKILSGFLSIIEKKLSI